MLGGECMIAPVYEQNAEGRYVYLPEDMLMIRFRSAQDYDLIPMEKGDHYISLGLGEFPLFVRNGHAVPLCRGGENVDEIKTDRLKMIGKVENEAVYDLYRDDGISEKVGMDGNITRIRVGKQELVSDIELKPDR